MFLKSHQTSTGHGILFSSKWRIFFFFMHIVCVNSNSETQNICFLAHLFYQPFVEPVVWLHKKKWLGDFGG